MSDTPLCDCEERDMQWEGYLCKAIRSEVGRALERDLAAAREYAAQIAREATDYLHAVEVLFAVQPEGDCLAERKPTKDDKAYAAFIYLNDQGKLLRAALAAPTNPSPSEVVSAMESVAGQILANLQEMLPEGQRAIDEMMNAGTEGEKRT